MFVANGECQEGDEIILTGCKTALIVRQCNEYFTKIGLIANYIEDIERKFLGEKKIYMADRNFDKFSKKELKERATSFFKQDIHPSKVIMEFMEYNRGDITEICIAYNEF